MSIKTTREIAEEEARKAFANSEDRFLESLARHRESVEQAEEEIARLKGRLSRMEKRLTEALALVEASLAESGLASKLEAIGGLDTGWNDQTQKEEEDEA